MILPGLRCGCGESDLISVEPGTAPEVCDLFSLTRDRPARGWCRRCAPWVPAQSSEAA